MQCVPYPVYPNGEICKTVIKFQNQDTDSHTAQMQNIPVTTEVSHAAILYLAPLLSHFFP